MQIMDSTGHAEISWNPGVPSEVEFAESTFDDMTDKGYRAFRVEGANLQGGRMDSFDPTARKIMFVPQLKGG